MSINPYLRTPKENSQFDDEYDVYIPKEGEIRLIGNKNR